jgi:ABC-type transport system involved in multi-copper enzyme maturation permease subunit
MIRLWLSQILAIIRLEMRKTFFSRRSLWIYLLASAPVILYLTNSFFVARHRQQLAQRALEHPIASQVLDTLKKGQNYAEVVERLGRPYDEHAHPTRRGRNGKRQEVRRCHYTDGQREVTLRFLDNTLDGIYWHRSDSLANGQLIFATSFQFYFLRLAVFFGCVGVFVNLFRGEMLDKSLHFYLLTPMRREVLLAGKYLAGLLATVVIFTSSTALQWLGMLWQFPQAAIADFLTGPGWEQFGTYLGVTVLACVGYGSVFLAIGLLFRNPIVPTFMVLLWESANPFLPPALKKISMIYYLQSLCPVSAEQARELPPMVHLLISPTEPATVAMAIGCIALLTGLVLVMAGRLARGLEINYGTE